MKQALIIEDDLDISEVLEELLTSLGFSVDKTFSYSEAVQFVQSYEYDLIISDVNLGEMSKKGTDVIPHAKGSPRVAFISGFPSAPEDTKEFVDRGAKFFTKPFNFNEIANWINEE